MSVDHLLYEWWVEDGNPWVRHLCNGVLDEWRLPAPWHLTNEGPRPSLHCQKCGAHSILTAADHVDRVGVKLIERIDVPFRCGVALLCLADAEDYGAVCYEELGHDGPHVWTPS